MQESTDFHALGGYPAQHIRLPHGGGIGHSDLLEPVEALAAKPRPEPRPQADAVEPTLAEVRVHARRGHAAVGPWGALRSEQNMFNFCKISKEELTRIRFVLDTV